MKRAVHVFDNGVKVYDDHLWASQRDRYKERNVHESEEEELFVGLIRDIPCDGCFVDIGSAIGYYPLLARRLAPGLTIHAVEPLERHRKRFIENIALNGLGTSDFTIHTEGISSTDGRTRFLERGYASAIQRDVREKTPFQALLSRIGREPSGNFREIETVTLDHLVERIGRHVDLCQMDVQGHELNILEGAEHSLRSGAVSTFLIGTHSPQLHRKCITRLVDRGYEIRHDVYETTEQPDGILVASKPSPV
jgi:FkbM family methyltransferase